MGECRYRLSFNSSYRCFKRGWLFGFCVEHALDRLRWEWRTRRFYVRIDLSRLARPYVQIDTDASPPDFVAVGIGVDGIDPAFEVCWSRDRADQPAASNGRSTDG